MQEALSGSEGYELSQYQALRQEFHRDRRLKLNDAVIPTLFPGEKLASVNATRPISQFEVFQHAVLRNIAAATGQSAEQVSKDRSKSNYSSARGALLEAWKSLHRRRVNFGRDFCWPIYGAMLEEAMELGELPLPAGAPDFIEARGAYMACNWMGPGRGWVDPVKEAQAAVLRMDAGITTLRHECAEQGLDVEEVIAERAQIIEMWKSYGSRFRPSAHDLAATEDERKPRPE